MMKKIIAWLPCELFYLLGHCSYWVLDKTLNEDTLEFNFLQRILWEMYQTLMFWSGQLNDWADLEVWSKPEE